MNNLINRLLDDPISPTVSNTPMISVESVDKMLILIKQVLFPGVYHSIKQQNIRAFLEETLTDLSTILKEIISRFGHLNKDAETLTTNSLDALPDIKSLLKKDIQAIDDGDPAAKGAEEVILAYPSFEAITIYRIANRFHALNLPLLARICSGIAHRKTGIDIHPNAKIGEYFCIDHGTGIVIGETAIIGNNVKLYQGVTIGALSVSKKQQNTKRHPTIGNNVTIYAGATILGGQTIIGNNSIIGGNVWLTKSVTNNSKVMNKDTSYEHSKENY